MPGEVVAATRKTIAAHALSVAEIFAELQTSASGITQEEARSRLARYGENKLSAKEGISPLRLYLSQFQNTLTIILIIAALVIFGIYFFDGNDQSELIEGGLILAIVFVMTLVGFFQEFKAEKAIASLKSMLAYKSRVVRGGVAQEIDVITLVPGDIVVLSEGDRVPADIRLTSVADLQVNEAALTGESAPVRKSIDVLLKEKPVSDQVDMVFAGTTIVSGRGVGVVVGTGDMTEIGAIAKEVADVKDEPTPIQRRLNAIGRTIGFLIIGICVVVFIFIVFFAHDFVTLPLHERIVHSFIASVALAVAAIPEGLPAVVTVALALGTQRMLRRQVLVRKLNAIETLGSTDVICSDKTGTLTKGEMTVTRVYASGSVYEVSGTGYETAGTFAAEGKVVDSTMLSPLLAVGYFCNNAALTENGILGDPTEAALLVSAKKAGVSPKGERVLEVPFSSERKMMSVVIKTGDVYTVYAKGAPEVILRASSTISEDGTDVPLTEQKKQELLSVTHQFSSQALRTLAFATKTVTQKAYVEMKGNGALLEKNLSFVGIQGMMDPPRTEVAPLIATCHASGIRVIMITGDHVETAKAVAKEIGIPGEAITGETLDGMPEAEFAKAVAGVGIYARVNPDFKLRIVAELQKRGHVVAMTGDGVNDAPALKKADIGIAMGKGGTDVAKEASDMVLQDNHFSTIVAAIEEGRGIYHNIRKFVTYLLSCNIAEVLIIFSALVLFQELPLSAIMLLWINVVTDGLPAIAMGLDPAEKGIMRHRPGVFQEQVIQKHVWVEMFAVGCILTALVIGIFTLNLQYSLAHAQAAAFTGLVFFEMVHVYVIRSSYRVATFANKWLLLSVGTTILLQVLLITTPFTRHLFGIEAISLQSWAYIVTGCIALWIASLLIKQIIINIPFRPRVVTT